MTQLTLDSYTPIVSRSKPARPSIEERFVSWSQANRHVLVEMLRLARAWLDRGDGFISSKALWEACRISLGAGKEGGYKLNNDFTAPAARWLLEQEPRLVGVIELRTRRAR